MLAFPAALFGGAAAGILNLVGLRRALIFGCIVLMVTGFMEATITDAYTFLTLRGMEGVGYSTVLLTAPSLIAKVSRDNLRFFALALWGSVVAAGFAVSALLFAVMEPMLGWRGIFALTAALMGGVALAAVVLLPQDESEPDVSRHLTIKSVLDSQLDAYRQPSAIFIGIAFGMYVICMVVVLTFLPAFLEQRWNLSARSAHIIASITPMTAVMGSLAAGIYFRRAKRVTVVAMASIVATPIVASFVYLGGSDLISVLSFMVYSLINGVTAAALFAIIPLHLNKRGQEVLGFGMITQCGALGMLCGPPLAGWAFERGGWIPVLMLVICAAFVGLVCLIVLNRLGTSSTNRSRIL